MGGYLSSTAGKKETDRVLIPVDRSVQAETAFDWYVRHVHQPGNDVKILHCMVQPSLTNFVSEHSYSPSKELEKEIDEIHDEGRLIIDKYKEKLKEAGISGSVLVGIGRPGEAVVDAVKHNNISLIVMGSRGYGVLRRTILGSVSRYVICHSGVPVCVLPKEKGRWF